KSVRMANLRLRIRALDDPRYRGVYRLGRNALGLATSGCSHETTGAGTVLHRQPGELLELSCAVAQLLRRHAEEVEHRELQVRQRRVFWIYEMAAALESARASADEQRRERTVGMAIAVADCSAVKNHHVIEQRSVAVWRIPELLQVIGEEFQVVLLNSGALRHFLRIVPVMCHRVMRLWNADLRVGPRTLLAAVHERADTRDV